MVAMTESKTGHGSPKGSTGLVYLVSISWLREHVLGIPQVGYLRPRPRGASASASGSGTRASRAVRGDRPTKLLSERLRE
jgi:hypothetical protein